MARSEEYSVWMECPQCHAAATVEMEAPENPVWHGSSSRVVGFPTETFEKRESTLYCKACGAKVWEPK